MQNVENIFLTIEDPIRRAERESFELFGRACSLQNSIYLLELTSPPKDQIPANIRKNAMYALTLVELTRLRDATIKNAVDRYNEWQKLKGEKKS